MSPSSEGMRDRAPEEFIVDFRTSKGEFSVVFTRDWASHGVDRVFNLVRNGFFDKGGGYERGARFYRVLKNWVCQFGVSPDPEISAVYDYRNDVDGTILPDDAVVASNERGTVSFSAAYSEKEMAVNRTTELYINYLNNSRLDAHGFAPVGRVASGLEVVDAFYDLYGEMVDACSLHPEKNNTCHGVNETLLYSQGEAYLEREFPRLDFILSASIRGEEGCGDNVGWALASIPFLACALAVCACASFVAYRKKRHRDRPQVQMVKYENVGDEEDEDNQLFH
ncbi:cyclophilin-type peptidyl-prolyl cis-trans isomerase [Chloropicon primus]|nr:cyclophilin-type peptidyl-prolyl cis-trans isomerase [Chloropicon primus]